MYRKQRGLTLISWLLLLAVAAAIGLAGMRLGPVYLEYMKVVSMMEGVRDELNGREPTPSKIKNALATRFNVENIEVLKFDEITIRREAAGFAVEAKYQHQVPYIANISFVVDFDKSVEIRR